MNKIQTAQLLAYAAARDNRKEDPAAVEAWFEDLGDLPFEDCKEAVRQHFQNSLEYLMPVHIRATVKTIRLERVRAVGDISDRIPRAIEELEDEEEHTRQSLAWLQEAKRRIGDGEDIDTVAPRHPHPPADLKSVDRIKEITEQIARDKNANDA